MNKQIKVLVVDDTRFNRKAFWYMLHDKYEILEAEDGEEALEILKKEKEQISLILLDPIMPKMDGIQFMEEKAKLEDCQEIPVLVCMSENQPKIEEQCLQLGAIDFVRKPFNPDVTTLRIQNSLELWRQLQNEKKRVTDVLNRYMDPNVVKNVLSQDKDTRDNQHRNISVLFADICGFTTMSEKLDSNELLTLLNQCCTVAGHCIKEHGGTLDKFIGDCAMAFWGAPEPCEDDAYLACAAALDIHKSMAIVNQTPEFQKNPITFSIGINKGDAVVGDIGMEEYMNYTAIGDTVNTAARLQSLAGSGDVYISRAIVRELGDRARCTNLGKFALKGKQEEFEVFRLEELLV